MVSQEREFDTPFPLGMVEVREYRSNIGVMLGSAIRNEVVHSEAYSNSVFGYLGAHFAAKWFGSSGVFTMVTTSPKGKSDGEEDDDPDCIDVGPGIDENILTKQKTKFDKKAILKHVFCSMRSF